jgi:hypothetical protein
VAAEHPFSNSGSDEDDAAIKIIVVKAVDPSNATVGQSAVDHLRFDRDKFDRVAECPAHDSVTQLVINNPLVAGVASRHHFRLAAIVRRAGAASIDAGAGFLGHPLPPDKIDAKEKTSQSVSVFIEILTSA